MVPEVGVASRWVRPTATRTCSAAGAEHGHEELRRVAAAPAPLAQRLLGGPDARLLPDHVADGAVDGTVQLDDERDGVARGREPREERVESRATGQGLVVGPEVGREVGREIVPVAEGRLPAAVVDEEVEGVHRPDVHGHLHQHLEPGQPTPLRERDLGDVVAGGVSGPPRPARLGHGEGVGLDAGLGVVGGSQPDLVRPERRRPWVAIDAAVLEEEPHGGDDGALQETCPAREIERASPGLPRWRPGCPRSIQAAARKGGRPSGARRRRPSAAGPTGPRRPRPLPPRQVLRDRPGPSAAAGAPARPEAGDVAGHAVLEIAASVDPALV